MNRLTEYVEKCKRHYEMQVETETLALELDEIWKKMTMEEKEIADDELNTYLSDQSFPGNR